MASNLSTQQTDHDPLELPNILVSSEWLLDNLGHPNLRLLDVRLAESYEEAHLPNAIWLDLRQFNHTSDGVAEMLIPPEQYDIQMGELGIDEGKTVVIYDDSWGMPAARVLWSLARYGHRDAALLNGGWDRWQTAGYPISTAPATPQPKKFASRPDANEIAKREWILDRLEKPDLVLLDTRSPAEFAQGHIPHAVNWDWMNGVPLDGGETIRPQDELRQELSTLGITPDKEIVTYCQAGARASHTYVLLRALGYPKVRNYDGSWLDWAQSVESS